MRKIWSARSLVYSHRESMDRPRVRRSFRHGRLIVAAVAHIIWSTLDDTSTYVPLTDPRMPTVMDLSKMPHFLEAREQLLANRAARDPRHRA